MSYFVCVILMWGILSGTVLAGEPEIRSPESALTSPKDEGITKKADFLNYHGHRIPFSGASDAALDSRPGQEVQSSLGDFMVNEDTEAPLGPNFKVDDAVTRSQKSPSVSRDASGNFVICWYDYRNGGIYDQYADIYAQRYNSSGVAQGTNFKVNSDAGTAEQTYPSVACDASGNFVVCWQDERNGNPDIYAQRYNSSGVAQGSNFKVNEDAWGEAQQYPSVSCDASGNFVVCWQDYRNGTADIYAQRYNSSGVALGVNFKVNDDGGTALQDDPSVSCDVSGNFVVCWEDSRFDNFYPDIYGQRYNSSGVAQGPNFLVTSNSASDPSVSHDGSGKFVICWQDYSSGNWDIIVQRYNSSGVPIGSTKVNDDAGTANQGWPSVSCDGSGSFVICWTDGRNGGSANRDTYAQLYTSSGVASGSNFKVNDDAGIAEQIYPSVSLGSSGSLVVCWQDGRNGGWDIYADLSQVSFCIAKPGDANASGTYNLADVIATVNYIFNQDGCTVKPLCWLTNLLCRGDWNGSGTVSLVDVIQAVNYIFNKPGGPWNALASGACCL